MWITRGFYRDRKTNKNSATVEKMVADGERVFYSSEGKGEKSTGDVDNFFMRGPDFSSPHPHGKADDLVDVEEEPRSFG